MPFESNPKMNTTLFKNGSTWIRADFHLHTHADKEFLFENLEKKRSFKEEYIAKLEAEGIKVGVITNHNKFDLEEYKSLRNCANRKDILLMSGVELSVNDGSNGIHCLIVFDYSTWVINGTNFIEQFLTSAFEGIQNRENENTRCNYNLLETLKKLEEHRIAGRDSFVVMAHIEDRSGFCHELQGGRITTLAQNELFKNFVLGLQKFRTHDKLKSWNQWFGSDRPAFLEGSDCKKIEEVGRAHLQNGIEKKCYLKLGDFNFEAVKYALIHHQERVSDSQPSPIELSLGEVRVMRGSDDTLTVPLNAGLNTIVGVRGGGKSSLLETIRFGLGLRAAQEDQKYKDEVVARLLGHGGQVELDFFDGHQRVQYSVKRRLGYDAQVFDSVGTRLLDFRAESLMKIAYFGQKDLATLGKNFNEKVFEETLLVEELKPYKEAIKNAGLKVKETIRQWEKIKKETEREQPIRAEIARLEQFIRVFEEKGLEAILRREHNYQQDATQLEIVADRLAEFTENLSDYLEGFDVDDLLEYSTEEAENQAFFVEEVFPHIQKYLHFREQAQQLISNELPAVFTKIREKFETRLIGLHHEFAKKKEGIDPSIKVEQYSDAKRNIQLEREKIGVIMKEKEKLSRFQKQLDTELKELQQAWKNEFEFIKIEVEKLNQSNTSVKIDIDHQGDKKRWMSDCLKGLASGTKLQESHYEKICEHYTNAIAIYRDMQQDGTEIQKILSGGGLLTRFQDKILENLADFLTSRTPDRYTFHYNGKDLSHYSIGQKATALVGFILSNHQKNLFLIDQPEDDLDNYTVAKEIIDRIKRQKKEAQFVFVTHNPNILVLGDSEQVVVCEHDSEQQKIRFSPIGSIDQPDIQQTAVNIMEGGKEAFERRKNIYQIWKH